MSDSEDRSRKEKKIKKHDKQKKQKKDKKEKKEKKHKKQLEKSDDDHIDHIQPTSKYNNKTVNNDFNQIVPVYLRNQNNNKQLQQVLPQRTHVNCRRCKNPTFSLKTRTCSTCGFPKQQRPAYFPVQKEINVHDMVKQGKLVHNSFAPVLIEVVANDRMGKRQRIKCCPTDSILDFKKLISAQIGTRPQKIRLQKANIIFKDHLTLDDYEIKDGMGLQMYYD